MVRKLNPPPPPLSVPLLPAVQQALVQGLNDGGRAIARNYPLRRQDGGEVKNQSWWEWGTEKAGDAAEVAADVGEHAVDAWQNPLVRGAVEVGGGFVPGVSEALDVYTIGEGAHNIYEGNYGQGAVDIGLGAAGLAIPFASNTQLKGGYKLAKGGAKAVNKIAARHGNDVAAIAHGLAKRHGGDITDYVDEAIGYARSGIPYDLLKAFDPDTYSQVGKDAHAFADAGHELATSGIKKAKEWTDAGVQSLQNLWGSEEEPEQKNAGGPISIKPENRGKFTQKANAAGMGVQAYANKVLSAPEGRYDPSTRKQANFARNANKWSK